MPTIPVGATQPIVFDFTGDLASGETISSATVTLSVYSGTDGSPAGNKSGGVTISGAQVSQKIKPVTASLGNIYQALCAAITSLSNTFQKAGLLAVPPDTDTTVISPPTAVSTYDSGLVTTAIAPTPVLTAGANLGGMYQLNIYLMVSTAAASGSISAKVYWTDRLTLAAQSATVVTQNAALTGSKEDTLPIDALVGTQILIEGHFSSVTGTPTYQLTCAVVRL